MSDQHQPQVALSRDTFNDYRSSQIWFLSFVTNEDSDFIDAALSQISKMELSQDQLIKLGDGALTAFFQFEQKNLESYNPDAVVECARIFLRIDDMLFDDTLLRSKLRGGGEVKDGVSAQLFLKGLIYLQREGHTVQALHLLENMSAAKVYNGKGVQKIENRGV